MSVVAPSLKRQWIAWGLGGLLILSVAGGILVANLPGKHLLSAGDQAAEGSIAAPDFEQPKWRIETYPAGGTGPITGAEREAIARQREKLSGVVTSVYDALFLEPSSLDKAVRTTFTRGAADVMLKTHAGLTRDATDVRITRRVARIGIEPEGVRRAAAWVKVIARAEVGGRAIDVKHRSILWLERESDGWRVIGFEVRQAPVDSTNGRSKGRSHSGGRSHSPSKGKKRR